MFADLDQNKKLQTKFVRNRQFFQKNATLKDGNELKSTILSFTAGFKICNFAKTSEIHKLFVCRKIEIDIVNQENVTEVSWVKS